MSRLVLVPAKDGELVEVHEFVGDSFPTQKVSNDAGFGANVEMLKMLKGVPLNEHLASAHVEYPSHLLPDSIRNVVDAVQGVVQCPYELSVQAVLCAISASFGSMTDARGLRGPVPLTLAMLACALSGDRKSSVDNEANKGITSAISELNSVLDKENQIVVFNGSFTVESLARDYDKSPIQIIRAADAATFFHSHSMQKDKVDGTVATIADAWSGFEIKQTRIAGNRLVENPRLGFALMTQERYFLDFIMNERFQQQGITARTLYHITKTLQGSRLIDKDSYKNGKWHKRNDVISKFHLRTKEAMREGLEAFAGRESRREIAGDDQVLDMMIDLNNDWEIELRDRPELQGDQWVSRRLEHSIRLAGLFDLYDGNDELTADNLYRAAQLVSYYFETYLRIKDFGRATPTQRKAEQLLEYLRARPKLCEVRQVVQAKTFGKSDEVRTLIRELDNQAKVEIVDSEAKDFKKFKLVDE